jgi:DNA-binding PadR family transcriptional regulator
VSLFCKKPVNSHITEELESTELEDLDVEEQQGKIWGNLEDYLRRFSKLVEIVTVAPETPGEMAPIYASQIAQALNITESNAHIWRKRWLNLGWIEPFRDKKRGCYQITEEGHKQLKEWSEQASSNTNKELWLTIPRNNSQKAAELLIKYIDAEQLKEVYKLVGESLNL